MTLANKPDPRRRSLGRRINVKVIVDQRLVVHVYAPIDGPSAEQAYTDVLDLWAGCRQRLRMLDPVADIGLPHHLPHSARDLPTGGLIDERALSVQERAGSE